MVWIQMSWMDGLVSEELIEGGLDSEELIGRVEFRGWDRMGWIQMSW